MEISLTFLAFPVRLAFIKNAREDYCFIIIVWAIGKTYRSAEIREGR